MLDPRGRGPSHAQSLSRSQSTGELLWSQEAKRAQDNVIRERVPWRGRNTDKHALSFDESEEDFTAEKAGRAGRGDILSQGVGLGQRHCVGSSKRTGLGTSNEQADTGGRRAEILRVSNNMGRS